MSRLLKKSNSSTYEKNIPLFGIISNWKFFLLFNILLIFGFLISLFLKELIFSVSFGLFLVSEIAVLLLMGYFSQLLTQYNEIEKMPFLIHEKYMKSEHFNIFKNNFFNDEKIQKEINKTGNFFIIAFSTGMLLFYLNNNLTAIMKFNNIFEAIGYFLLHSGAILFLLYFIFVITVGGLFLIISLKYLTFVSTKVPLKINPWEDQQEIQKITYLWKYSLIFTFFLTFVFPLVLNLSNLLQTINAMGNLENRVNQISALLITYPLLYYLIEATIIFIFIIAVLLAFDRNVTRRKNELIQLTRKEIVAIKSLNEPTNRDIAKIPLLLKKNERINKIPSISNIDGVTMILINIILPIIFLIIGLVLG